MEHFVAGCKQGDRKAQEALYKQLSAKMMGVCMRYAASRTDAEDILQMGFVKMFQKITYFKNEGSFEGWVRRIMVNTAIELYRKNVRLLHTVELEGVVEVDDANALSQLAVKDLMQLVQNLPDGYRMVFNLYAIEGYSHKEIAEQLGISEGGSKSQLSRARNYLQEKIRKLEEKEER
jgi:RNA polymerase sigma-70 factor (ECF subfamily)